MTLWRASALLTCSIGATAILSGQDQGGTVWDGVYNASQADRGEQD